MWPSGNQALPLFIIGLIVLFAHIFENQFKWIMRKMKMMDAEEDEFVVDEKLGTYFECISMWDRKQWLATELHAT